MIYTFSSGDWGEYRIKGILSHSKNFSEEELKSFIDEYLKTIKKTLIKNYDKETKKFQTAELTFNQEFTEWIIKEKGFKEEIAINLDIDEVENKQRYYYEEKIEDEFLKYNTKIKKVYE